MDKFTSWYHAVISIQIVGTILRHKRPRVGVIVEMKRVLWTQRGGQQLVVPKHVRSVRDVHFTRHALLSYLTRGTIVCMPPRSFPPHSRSRTSITRHLQTHKARIKTREYHKDASPKINRNKRKSQTFFLHKKIIHEINSNTYKPSERSVSSCGHQKHTREELEYGHPLENVCHPRTKWESTC